MSYDYITKYDSQNYYAAANVPKHYGVARSIKGITIHHWGIRGQKFQNVVNFLCRKGGNTSAHYVVEDGKVACIVDPKNAAWHAGNSIGNATTVGVECRPEATDGDYETVAELIAELWHAYGKVKLYRHKDWKNTACPGAWNIDRLHDLAESKYKGTNPPIKPVKPAPAKVYRSVRRGSRNGTVGKVQAALRSEGYTKQIVDNVFGPQTEANVRDFQRRTGLVVDGIAGKITQRRLGL